MKINKTPLGITAGLAALLALAQPNVARAALIADSKAEFSGVQGQNGWTNGYRDVTIDAGGIDYDPLTAFIPFAGGEGQGPWDGVFQLWTGTAWDLETAAAGPWTTVANEAVHPNGVNSGNEHWAIRRWAATELTGNTWLAVTWNARKQNLSGAGVTGALHVNGVRVQGAAIAGNDGGGVTNTYWVLAKPTDLFDVILSPVGPTGDTGDGADGSYTWMTVNSTADSDADGIPDAWEEIYFPGDLTKLSANGDFDGDGLKDLAEFQRGSDPTKADSDADGLADGVETGTGTYVSPSNTGTNPMKPDTDGDGRKDGEEVNGTPKTDPNNPDTDGDGYSDGSEVASGHNPNDPTNNPDTTWIADSKKEWTTDGTQGVNNWYNGYRNYSADGGGINYNADSAFIPFGPEIWVGTGWDMAPSTSPWTELYSESVHPSGSSPTHWVIRRWVAATDEITKKTPLAIRWHVRKTNTGCGNGVTGALHINGIRVDSAVIAFNDGTGVIHTFYANVSVGDKIDLILSSRGADNNDQDGCDGSAFWMIVDTTIPPNPVQPDGSVFIPVGAGDTDADGMPDAWEQIYFPGDLTKLTQNGDFDGDGLKDPLEYARGSDPTKADTDGDGLSDLVETATGKWVSPTDTGSSPKTVDTDGDGLSDFAEATRVPPTDPNKTDTDGDGFSDPTEIDWGTNPLDPADNPLAQVIANSQAEFSGTQGQDGWYNGYRIHTAGTSTDDYDANADFIPFDSTMWNGGAWDLDSGGAAPWTTAGPLDVHPNGTNNQNGGPGYNEEHWQIRRWVATEVTQVTPLALIWHVHKGNTSGNGVTGSLHVNGKQVDHLTIPGNDGIGQIRHFYVNLKPGDIVDLALTPVGPSGDRSDGADGSQTWLWVDKKIPKEPRQPDGTLFIPAGAADSDADGLLDFWELIYAADLNVLTGTGDNDGDGLKNTDEQARDGNPLMADTDGDGLGDAAESNTGVFVSATNTGSSPRKADTDGDGINDGVEVNRTPPLNPNKVDTDGDTYTDPQELAEGSDPTNPNDTPLTFVIADSQKEFSGVQGQNGWYNGYRIYNPVAGTINYNANQDFIPFDASMWTGTIWDLDSGGNAPWTMQGALDVHPNGTNNPPVAGGTADPTNEQWPMRRWVATELTKDTPVTIVWNVHKASLANNGVTGLLFVNGALADSKAIAGTDGVGEIRKYRTTLKQGDIVDLALSPLAPDGDRFDYSDGSQTWYYVDARPYAATSITLAVPVVNTAAGTVSLKWNSTAGANYTVWKSADLKTWTQQTVASGGAETTYTDTLGTPQPAFRFYRVSQQ